MIATLKNDDLVLLERIIRAIGQMDNFQKGYFLGRAEEMASKTEEYSNKKVTK